MNARPTGRLFLQAGVSTGRTVTKTCSVVDNPQTLRFCEVAEPFLPNYRVSGGYTFPWQLQVSGVFQSIAPHDGHRRLVTGEQCHHGHSRLGRPIATAGGVINAPLIDPVRLTASIADRVNQLDLRLTKGFRVGRCTGWTPSSTSTTRSTVSPVQTTQRRIRRPHWLAPHGDPAVR